MGGKNRYGVSSKFTSYIGKWVQVHCVENSDANGNSRLLKIKDNDKSRNMDSWGSRVYVSNFYGTIFNKNDYEILIKDVVKSASSRYWVAHNIKAVPTKKFALSIACSVCPEISAEVISKFEEKYHGQLALSNRGKRYSSLWRTHIENFEVSKTGIAKRDLFIRCHDAIKRYMCNTGERDEFVTELRSRLSGMNLSGQIIEKLVELVPTEDDWVGVYSHSITKKSDTISDVVNKVVETWLSRPFSPYLTFGRKKLTVCEREVIERNPFRTCEAVYKNDKVWFLAYEYIVKKSESDTYVAELELLEKLRNPYRGNLGPELSALSDGELRTIILEQPKFQILPFASRKLNFMDLPESVSGITHNSFVQDPALPRTMDTSVYQLTSLNEKEVSLARSWQDMMTRELDRRCFGFDVLRNHEKEKHMFEEAQHRAFVMAFSQCVSCITGGPGTGKTWLSYRICKAWRQNVGEVVVTSSYNLPLDNMKDRMSKEDPELFKMMEFRTVTSMLCNPDQEEWSVDNRLLLVEEAGTLTLADMAGIFQLVCKSENRWHVVMAGDKDQLSPIGAGQPFADFAELYPERTTFLTVGKRTDAKSIMANITSIKNGRSEIVCGDDFLWIDDVEDPPTKTKSWQEDSRKINVFGENFVNKYLSEFNMEEDVVIVHTNIIRIALNRALYKKHFSVKNLRDLMYVENPGDFRLGTRVICMKSSGTGKDKISTGTRGVIISKKNADKKSVRVMCRNGTIVTDKACSWSMDYAITAHKSQGCEYGRTFVYSSATTDWNVDRSWLYTAVSRTKNQCVYLAKRDQHVRISNREKKQNKSLLGLRIAYLGQNKKLYEMEEETPQGPHQEHEPDILLRPSKRFRKAET